MAEPKSQNTDTQKEEKKSEMDKNELHWEYYHSKLDESPTFESNKRSKLEKELYEYFNKTGLIKSEMTSDENVLQDINNTLQCKLKDIKSIQQFMYSNKEKSALFSKKTNNDDLILLSRVPHDCKLWNKLYLQCKQTNEWQTRTKLWMLIQHQTVTLITNKYNIPPAIRNELEHCIGYSDKNKAQTLKKKSARPYINKMQIGTQNMDCIIVGLHLKKAGYNPVILNLANQEAPAAAITKSSEGGTQEENIMKRSTLYLSLWPHKNPNKSHNPAYQYDNIFMRADQKEQKEQKEIDQSKKKGKWLRKRKNIVDSGFYPMHDKYGGIYSKNVYVFRGSESSGYALLPLEQRCVLSFIAVAARVHYSMRGLSKNEIDAYKHKIRSIFQIAYQNGHDAIVLGAMGCGIFNNPPEEVAKIFYDVLMNEFNGCFARVAFAILWDHNSKPLLVESFCKYFPQNEKLFHKL